MSDQPKKSSFFEKLATFIVDKRNLIFFLYAIAIFASLITQSWVSVCNDLTEYLPETTEPDADGRGDEDLRHRPGAGGQRHV